MARHRSRQAALARLALLAATLIWGTSFAIIQRALIDLPVFHLLTYRFTLATLLLLPLLVRGIAGIQPRELLRDGLVLGVLLFAGFALQTSGLLWTTPSRSAFLIGLAVVMVPPLAWASNALSRGLHRPRREPDRDAASGGQPGGLRLGPAAGALLAAAGLYVLYHPTAAAGSAAPAGRLGFVRLAVTAGSQGFGRGDAMTLAATFAFACHIVGIERAVRRRASALAPLAAVQFAVVAVLAAPSLLLAPPHASELTTFALFTVLFSAVVATALAYLCQLYAQRHLGAAEAAVVLTFEPVVAALFSVAVGRESWTSSLAVGGVLIVAAMLLAELGGGPDGVPPTVATPGC